MRYMMFIKHTEDYENVEVPGGLHEAMGGFIGEMTEKGHLIETAGLQPSSQGHRVRLRGGQISVIDGPFTETKELVGGYAVIEAATREQALELARRFMDIHRIHWPAFEGECEVRPLEGEAQPAA